MAELFSDYEDPAHDDGVWLPFAKGVELRIRAIPARTLQALEAEVLGKKREYRESADGEKVAEVDPAKARLLALRKTRLALVDSRGPELKEPAGARAPGFEVRVGDEGAAKDWRAILPEGTRVEAGLLLCLDGLWTDAVRDRVSALHPGLAFHVTAASAGLTVQAERAEAEAEGKG